MTTPRLKAKVGITLLILFLVTIVSGIILHLKKHGVIIEPRPVIKTIHWITGFLMVAFTCWHAQQFWKMFSNIRKRYLWFWYDTWAVIFFIGLTFATGLVKLISPVRIPHLGLWHYCLGIVMIVVVAIHLIRGIPGWNRLRKL